MTDQLPRWVWDLLADLLDEEEVHPRYLHLSGGMSEPAPWPWCPAAPLARVPADVRIQAEAIAEYRRSVTTQDRSYPGPPAGDKNEASTSGRHVTEGAHDG